MPNAECGINFTFRINISAFFLIFATMLYTFIKGIIIGVFVSAPVGPIGVLCLQRTLNRGKAHGFATGCGAMLSDMIYAMIAGFSMSMVIGFIEDHKLMLEIIGSLVVFFFGLHTYRDNPVAKLRNMTSSKGSIVQDFLSSFGLTITNPLVVFLFIGVFSRFSILTSDTDTIHNVLSITSILIGALAWWLLIVNVADIFRSRFNLRGLVILNKLTGSILMLLSACTLIYTVFSHLFS